MVSFHELDFLLSYVWYNMTLFFSSLWIFDICRVGISDTGGPAAEAPVDWQFSLITYEMRFFFWRFLRPGKKKKSVLSCEKAFYSISSRASSPWHGANIPQT